MSLSENSLQETRASDIKKAKPRLPNFKPSKYSKGLCGEKGKGEGERGGERGREGKRRKERERGGIGGDFFVNSRRKC